MDREVHLMLGVRPHRLSYESLTGYLFRLAYLNGFQSITEFLWYIGVRPAKNRRWGHYSEKELNSLLPCLSAVLRRDASSALVDHYDQSWLFDAERVFQHALVDFPRVCLCCLANDKKPIFDWRWQLGFLPLCPVHQTPLYNNCPACGESFAWSTHLFERCPSCHVKWVDIRHEPLAEHAGLNELVCPAQDGQSKLTKPQLDDVMLALLRVGRPFDVLTHSSNAIPLTNDHCRKALLALQLLHEPAVYHDWQLATEQRWHDVSTRVHPVLEFSQLLKFDEWPCLSEYQLGVGLKSRPALSWDKQAPEFVKRSRAKAAKHQEQNEWCYHVNHPLLAQALGISTKTLTALGSSMVLPQLNSTNVIREKLFSLVEVSKALAPFHKKQAFKSAVKVTEGSRCFARYLSAYGELLEAGLSGHLNVRFPEQSSLALAEVSYQELQAFLLQQFETVCTDSIGKTKVARALGIASTQISEHVKAQHFYWAGWRNDESVDGPSFRAFYQPPPLSDCL